ncbi:MAG TPA: rubrerythrin family protein [Acidobacteriaceae bacterium]|nr:rubrerythrin family protein [Acidobacteriaceae bacterium]
MKTKLGLAAFAIAIAFFLIGHIAAQQEKKLNEKTAQNLSTAMHGEAFAYAKYLLFAEKARRDGNPELADLLEKTAKTERFEHFAEEAKLAGLVGSDAANLKDAIQGESYESSTMYREFAQQAQQAGDHEAAQRFEEIRQDEMKHRDAFTAALNKLEKGHPGGY